MLNWQEEAISEKKSRWLVSCILTFLLVVFMGLMAMLDIEHDSEQEVQIVLCYDVNHI